MNNSLIDARFIKKVDGTFWLELNMYDLSHLSSIGILNLCGTIDKNIVFSNDQIPDDDIELSVNATIKTFYEL